MKKLIATALFTMFAIVSGGSHATVAAHDAHTVAAVSTGSTVEAEPTTNAFDPVCTPAYVLCTDDCKDLSGNARGACLRICRAEYNECLAH
jgi:hypothetical protein